MNRPNDQYTCSRTAAFVYDKYSVLFRIAFKRNLKVWTKYLGFLLLFFKYFSSELSRVTPKMRNSDIIWRRLNANPLNTLIFFFNYVCSFTIWSIINVWLCRRSMCDHLITHVYSVHLALHIKHVRLPIKFIKNQ